MGHMHISGTEPSSVTLSQTSKNIESNVRKVTNKAEAERGGVINQHNYNFDEF